MDELIDYISRHTEILPSTSKADSISLGMFGKVVIKGKPDADTLRKLVENHTGGGEPLNPLDGNSHSYDTIGYWLGDYSDALKLIALAQHLGLSETIAVDTYPGMRAKLIEKTAGAEADPYVVYTSGNNGRQPMRIHRYPRPLREIMFLPPESVDGFIKKLFAVTAKMGDIPQDAKNAQPEDSGEGEAAEFHRTLGDLSASAASFNHYVADRLRDYRTTGLSAETFSELLREASFKIYPPLRAIEKKILELRKEKGAIGAEIFNKLNHGEQVIAQQATGLENHVMGLFEHDAHSYNVRDIPTADGHRQLR